VPDVPAAVIVVSGDIAFSGGKEEYAIAVPKLQAVKAELARRLRDVPIHSLAVPGNHDCDFHEPGSIREIVIEKLNDDPSVPFADDACDACTAVQKEFMIRRIRYGSDVDSKLMNKRGSSSQNPPTKNTTETKFCASWQTSTTRYGLFRFWGKW
jgi:hypothetical protein